MAAEGARTRGILFAGLFISILGDSLFMRLFGTFTGLILECFSSLILFLFGSARVCRYGRSLGIVLVLCSD